MTFEKLSKKQKQIFKWCYGSDYKAIICDGAVRSGKTVCMIASFILWAMREFNGANFGICGKTIASAERNIVSPVESIIDITAYFNVKYKRGSQNALIIENKNVRNTFYIFGGKDQSSYQLLQGITLSGIFFDEVALMPENFVQQGLARCLSVEEAKYWFNCNPESPHHWFYEEWIMNAKKRKALHIHMLMSDNPTISEKQLKEAEMQFSGVFYERYILGLWVMAEGLIYPMYEQAFGDAPERTAESYAISIDYGTMNAFSVTLWGKYNDVWWGVDEYYYSGREKGETKTDDEYFKDLEGFLVEYGITSRIYTVIDPSAASFIAILKKRTARYNVRKANNDVIKGIEQTAVAIQRGLIKFSHKCKNTKREFSGYVWDDKATEDKPVKVNDHCLTGETLVMTENGNVPISELVGTTGRVWSYNTITHKSELKTYRDCRMTQRAAQIYRIELEDGRCIRCTGEHPILTENGYKRADKLTANDRIIEV